MLYLLEFLLTVMTVWFTHMIVSVILWFDLIYVDICEYTQLNIMIFNGIQRYIMVFNGI